MKLLPSYDRFLSWYKNQNHWKIVSFIVGIIALCWFLVRVIPKPSRAFYPCQRAAFPIASGFIIWLAGMVSSVGLFKRTRKAFQNYKFLTGILLAILASVLFLVSMNPERIRSYAASVLQTRPEAITFTEPSTPITEPVSLVSIVQSEKGQSSDLTRYDIDDMVREAVELSGGLDKLISDGQTVVLKPNLLTSRTLPYDNTATQNLNPGDNGIVTDYRIIQSMVDIIRELNPNGKIILIEGSGVGDTRSNFDRVGWDNVNGMDSVIFLDEICGWQEKNSPALIKATLPESKALYTGGSEFNTYYMSKVYYEADVLISLPCLKNHASTGFTGGIKNVGIGATPPPIYGWGPNNPDIPNERWNPDNGVDHGTETNRDPLHNWIHDFFLARPVDFVLMDGIQGIENGPGAHLGRLSSNQENMRMILASYDPVALDAIGSLICGQDPYRIKYISSLHRDEAGNMNPGLIRVLGKDVDEVKRKFRIFGSGSMTTYNDFTAPEVVIRSYSLNGNNLLLDLTCNEDIAKVEISVNGIKEPLNVVDEFYQINFPLSTVPAYMSQIEISVFDPYLNCTRIQLGGTSTDPIENVKKEINCYPNPASDYLIVSLPEDYSQTDNLEIIDLAGKVVKTINPDKRNEVKIDLSDLDSGQYFLRYASGNGHLVKKFILDSK